MLHNDISNSQSFVIGFRCENSLLHFKDGAVANAIKGKFHRADIDQEVLSIMRYVYWETEYTVALVIDNENYTQEAKDFLAEFPFNRAEVVLKSISEVTAMLNTGVLTYYVSNDNLDRTRVNSRYAVDSKTFNTMLRRKVKKFE